MLTIENFEEYFIDKNGKKWKCLLNLYEDFLIILISSEDKQIFRVGDLQIKKNIAHINYLDLEKHDHREFLEIDTIPDLSGRGIGSALIPILEKYLKKRCIEKIEGEIYKKHVSRAKSFWGGTGFTIEKYTGSDIIYIFYKKL